MQSERQVLELAPAYVSGFLHAGHFLQACHWYALAKVLHPLRNPPHSEAQRRLREALESYPVTLSRGLDVNGNPIVRRVMRQNDSRPLIQRCHQYVMQTGAGMRQSYRAWGMEDVASTHDQYQTDDARMSQLLHQFLRKAEQKGVLSRGVHPVLHCGNCGTAVSRTQCDLQTRIGTHHRIPVMDDQGTSHEIITTQPRLLRGIRYFGYSVDDDRYGHLEGRHLTLTLKDGTSIRALVRPSAKISRTKGTGLMAVTAYGNSLDVEILREWGQAHQVSLVYDGRGCLQNPLQVELLPGVAYQAQVRELCHTQRADCGAVVVYTTPAGLLIHLNPQDKCTIMERLPGILGLQSANYLHTMRSLIQRLEPWSISRDPARYYSLPLPGTAYVADTWLISALLTQRLEGWYHRLMGTEILSTWLLYTLVVQHIMDAPRLRSVTTHGVVLDPMGRKISKSLNNGPDLHQLTQRYGLSVLRRGILAKDYAQDFRLAQEDFQAWLRIDQKLHHMKRYLAAPRLGLDQYAGSGVGVIDYLQYALALYGGTNPPLIHPRILGSVRGQIYQLSRHVLTKALTAESWDRVRARVAQLQRVMALYG